MNSICSIRFIGNEEEFKGLIQFLLNNQEPTKLNDNYLNIYTKIDFSRQALIVSHEAIIKNIYNSDVGYVIEFQDEVRAFSDHFYSTIVTRNPRAEQLFFLNKRLGPYMDTQFYPDFLNNMVDYFENLNNDIVIGMKEKSLFDLKREVSTMISSEASSKKSTASSFKCDAKHGKVIIISCDEEFSQESIKKPKKVYSKKCNKNSTAKKRTAKL